MAYNYYQQNYPGWGTPQFQMGPPPTPAFRPEAAWSGWDYYRAHAINPSRSLFDSILDRIRGYGGSRYASTHEARSIHLRLYGGFLSLNRVMPGEIGSAAAYEAYRSWKYHGSLLQPLGGHYGREREALVGLALAEASRLWQYTGRSTDTYGLQDALESAALTASRLYEKRAGKSFDGGGASAGPIFSRDYTYNLHRRHSSIPSVIRAGSASPYMSGGSFPQGPPSVGGTPFSGSVGLAGTPMSNYSSLRSSPYAGGGAALTTVQGGGAMYGATLQPTAVPVQPAGMVIPQPRMTALSYGQPMGYGYPQQQPVVIQQQPFYSPSGYGGAGGGYRAGGYGGGGGYASSNRPIIIDASGRSRSHSHGHHSHHRSRSTDPVYRSHHRHHGDRYGYL